MIQLQITPPDRSSEAANETEKALVDNPGRFKVIDRADYDQLRGYLQNVEYKIWTLGFLSKFVGAMSLVFFAKGDISIPQLIGGGLVAGLLEAWEGLEKAWIKQVNDSLSSGIYQEGEQPAVLVKETDGSYGLFVFASADGAARLISIDPNKQRQLHQVGVQSLPQSIQDLLIGGLRIGPVVARFV